MGNSVSRAPNRNGRRRVGAFSLFLSLIAVLLRERAYHAMKEQIAEEYPKEPREARVFCVNLITRFRQKAEKHKKEMFSHLKLTLLCTLGTSFLVAFGDGHFASRILPAIMSAIATG